LTERRNSGHRSDQSRSIEGSESRHPGIANRNIGSDMQGAVRMDGRSEAHAHVQIHVFRLELDRDAGQKSPSTGRRINEGFLGNGVEGNSKAGPDALRQSETVRPRTSPDTGLSLGRLQRSFRHGGLREARRRVRDGEPEG
jgi:hypothetical protein